MIFLHFRFLNYLKLLSFRPQTQLHLLMNTHLTMIYPMADAGDQQVILKQEKLTPPAFLRLALRESGSPKSTSFLFFRVIYMHFDQTEYLPWSALKLINFSTCADTTWTASDMELDSFDDTAPSRISWSPDIMPSSWFSTSFDVLGINWKPSLTLKIPRN